MLVVNSCLTRSTTSSLYFDILFASVNAVLDERRNYGDDGTVHKSIPLHPTWWFYNFRMYTQAVLLCYNLAKFVYEAQQNDMMVILSAVRCICVIIILARHHYYCRYKWLEMSEGLWNDRFTAILAFSMIGYNVVGAIAAGVDPYFSVDRTAMVLFFIMPVALRFVALMISKLYSKLTTRTVNQTVVAGRVIPPLLIFYHLVASFFFLLCIVDSSSPWLVDRVLMLCNLSFSAVAEVLQMRKRVLAERMYVQPVNAAVVVPVSGETEEELAINDKPQYVQEQPITTPQVADADAGNDARTSNQNDATHDVIEKLKRFTDAKRSVLWVQVTGTFLVVISAELVLSMTLYRLTGVPTVWCAPFAFQDVNNGFQVVLDYFL